MIISLKNVKTGVFIISAIRKNRFNGDEIVTGSAGYSAWWSKEYERREKDDL